MAWQFVSDTVRGEFTLTMQRQGEQVRVLVSRGGAIGIAEFFVNPAKRSILSARQGALTIVEIDGLRPVVLGLDLSAMPRGVRLKKG